MEDGEAISSNLFKKFQLHFVPSDGVISFRQFSHKFSHQINDVCQYLSLDPFRKDAPTSPWQETSERFRVYTQ